MQPQRQAPPPVVDETSNLLALTTQVIEARSAEERRGIETTERARFDATPTYDNLLRLALVRSLSGALPSELQETRADLQALANGRQELTANQRRLALLALIMVDERLRMGEQITNLQRQIDSLTEIEATLKDNDVNGAAEQIP